MKKFAGLYIVCLSVLGVFVWACFSFNERLTALRVSENLTTHTYRVIDELKTVENILLKAETGHRGFLLTNDSAYLQPYLRAKENVFLHLDTLKQLISDNQLQLNNLALLKATIVLRLQYLFESLEQKRNGNEKGLREKLDLSKHTTDDYRGQMQNMTALELQLLDQRKLEKQKHERLTPAMFQLVFMLSGFFLIASMVVMVNALRKRIRYQKELERKVVALNISNEELEQYAFVTSHSLQEPLRKIRAFSSMLVHKQKDRFTEDGNLMMGKIDVLATQVQGMLNDVIAFTNIGQQKHTGQPVDLKLLVEKVAGIVREKYPDNGPEVLIGELPVVKGIPEQLEILLLQLFDNSIKHRVQDRALAVSIGLQPLNNDKKLGKKYYKVCFTDNGKGFDNAYKNKLFKLFQRLEDNNGVETGRGMGLSICKRIMENHNGLIDAHGTLDKHATIELFFPKN